MKLETFYRYLSDQKIVCHNCQHPFNVYRAIVREKCFYDGRPGQYKCKKCGEILKVFEWRDYGVKKPFHKYELGLPGEQSPRRIPLQDLPDND